MPGGTTLATVLADHGSVDTGVADTLPDRFERENVEFFRRVREIYLGRARERPERYAVIDASADEATVTERMIRAIEERLL